MKISSTIKQLRIKNNLTQNELAETLHVSRSTITKWETDRGIPDITNILNISQIYHVNLDELLLDDEQVKRKVIKDQKTKKWHYLICIHLALTLIYLMYLGFAFKVYLIGYFIATCFILGIEIMILKQNKKA